MAGKTNNKNSNEKSGSIALAVHKTLTEAIGHAIEIEGCLDDPKALQFLDEMLSHLDKSQAMFAAYELATANVPLTIENICRVMQERCGNDIDRSQETAALTVAFDLKEMGQ